MTEINPSLPISHTRQPPSAFTDKGSKVPLFIQDRFKKSITEAKNIRENHKVAHLKHKVQIKFTEVFIRIIWSNQALKELKFSIQKIEEKLKSDHIQRENRVAKNNRTYYPHEHNPRMPELQKDVLSQCQEEIATVPTKMSTLIAKAHLQATMGQSDLIPIPSGDGNTWNALRITTPNQGPTEIEPNKIWPTSARSVGQLHNLNNIYFHIADDGHVTLTCGVIDTERKAHDFMHALGIALKQRKEAGKPDVPLRIHMHQLNSMGSGPGVFVAEQKLVNHQHQMTILLIKTYLKFCKLMAFQFQFLVHM